MLLENITQRLDLFTVYLSYKLIYGEYFESFNVWIFNHQMYDLVDFGRSIEHEVKQIYYDQLKQIAIKPNMIYQDIFRYQSQGIEGLFTEIQNKLGRDNRTIVTNPSYK